MHNTVSLRKKRIQLLSTFGKQDQLRSKGLQKKTGKFVWKKKVRTQIASGGIISKGKKEISPTQETERQKRRASTGRVDEKELPKEF